MMGIVLGIVQAVVVVVVGIRECGGLVRRVCK